LLQLEKDIPHPGIAIPTKVNPHGAAGDVMDLNQATYPSFTN
jgi:hypothetical protein